MLENLEDFIWDLIKYYVLLYKVDIEYCSKNLYTQLETLMLNQLKFQALNQPLISEEDKIQSDIKALQSEIKKIPDEEITDWQMEKKFKNLEKSHLLEIKIGGSLQEIKENKEKLEKEVDLLDKQMRPFLKDFETDFVSFYDAFDTKNKNFVKKNFLVFFKKNWMTIRLRKKYVFSSLKNYIYFFQNLKKKMLDH